MTGGKDKSIKAWEELNKKESTCLTQRKLLRIGQASEE